MSFRYRPRSLLLRRMSSCSALPLNQRKSKSNDWTQNDGTPPSKGLFNINEGAEGGEGAGGDTPKKEGGSSAQTLQVPVIKLEPLREGGVEHISCIDEPDMPCHFCREATSKPVHEDCTRLKIVSRGKS